MSRSRSSFDLSGAIATATNLATVTVTPEEQPAAFYRQMPLVSFGPTASGPATVVPPDSVVEPPRPPPPPAPPPPDPRIAQAVSLEASQPEIPVPEDPARRPPPKLPDLSAITSPTQRCERIIEWIVEAVGAADVFIADASGLPIAGVDPDIEARLAAAGVVAASVAHLAAAVPGNTSTLFELHVGDGPFFQLIGFEVADAQYVVGLHRATPLGFRQAHAVRLACRHALSLSDGSSSEGDGDS